MKAVAVRSDETEPTLLDVPKPTPEDGEALVRTLRVGIDGTDHEVISGSHGGYPAGADHQILGHEAVGVVADATTTRFEEGDLVVPTVRRPPASGSNIYFDNDEPDMAPAGDYVERGIAGAHGYMSEYFTSPERYLVPVPDDVATYGFLIEPISNSEKAIEHAFAGRSAFQWTPEFAFVLGNGPLGLLTLAILEQNRGIYDTFERIYCLGRRDRPDPTIDIIEQLGATYVDARETSPPEMPAAHEPIDFVYEATGYAKHAPLSRSTPWRRTASPHCWASPRIGRSRSTAVDSTARWCWRTRCSSGASTPTSTTSSRRRSRLRRSPSGSSMI